MTMTTRDTEGCDTLDPCPSSSCSSNAWTVTLPINYYYYYYYDYYYYYSYYHCCY